ncbi:hypothetical protein [Olleya aquimaris]|uniref:Uncharacterized protein n=1 Tax=Olleya aquimaris TaxID=639310 RepID=A0A327R876_9FLAO|nr:hypothetical protein [Olleya aquimaris]RAJ11884.1 hypothetical protein LY08_02593 [Olleya aquimaris]
MIFNPTNIESKLRKQQLRDLDSHTILDQVYSILKANDDLENRIVNTLQSGQQGNSNLFDIDKLEADRIFHIDSIKKTCIDYRLRFLDTKYFKNQFPREAISRIKHLEKTHNTSLKGFKIMAPSKLFKLENPDDPLLFAPIGNGYYYLIHKWGNDLNPFRKWLVLPFKNFENLLIFALLTSVIITVLFNFNLTQDQHYIGKMLLLFLFMFKSVVGIVIFYAISQGKNVNTAIWNSKYSK